MNKQTLMLAGAGILGYLWYRNNQTANFQPGGPSPMLTNAPNFMPVLPSLPQTLVTANNPASISAPILSPGGFMPITPITTTGDVEMPTAPSAAQIPSSNVFVLPWGMYRPDYIEPGTIHAYSWTSPDLNVNPLTYFKPYVESLPSDYNGAQGFDMSLSLTPGDFSTSAIKIMSDPRGAGQMFYVGDQSRYPWAAGIASNTAYYFNIRPLPESLGLQVWTQ